MNGVIKKRVVSLSCFSYSSKLGILFDTQGRDICMVENDRKPCVDLVRDLQCVLGVGGA